MKRPLLVLTTVCFLALTGCSKDDPIAPSEPQAEEEPAQEPQEPEEPESPVYFTFTARNEEVPESVNKNRWVVVHDSEGVFLDYKKIEPGATVVFESEETVSDKISVTLFDTYQHETFPQSSQLQTFMAVDKGKVWAEADYRTVAETGSFTFDATNVPDWASVILTSRESSGAFFTSDFYGYQYPDVEAGNLHLDNVAVGEEIEEDFIFSVLDKQGKSGYLQVPGVQDGDSVIVDASQLSDFDQVLSVDLPAYKTINFSVVGMAEESGKLKSQLLQLYFGSSASDVNLETVELGYLNTFENYGTSFSISNENSSYGYYIVGSPLSTFTVPASIAFEVINDSSTDFSYTTDAAITYQSVSWQAAEPFVEGNNGSEHTSWYVLSPAQGFEELLSLPEALIEESGIYLEDFKYNGTTLYTKSDAYAEVMDSRFSGTPNTKIIFTETENFSFRPAIDVTGKQGKNKARAATQDLNQNSWRTLDGRFGLPRF